MAERVAFSIGLPGTRDEAILPAPGKRRSLLPFLPDNPEKPSVFNGCALKEES
jgi:hypothetical protein